MNWPSVQLGEICSPKQHPTISSGELTAEGYPAFGANGQIGFYKTFTHDRITVAITCRGATCGTVNVVPAYSYISGNAMALDNLDDKRVDFQFLTYALRSRGLADVISGSAQPQITRAPLLGVRIPLPPLTEQKRIAAVLDRADELRRKRQLALTQLEGLSEAIFVEMFGNPSAGSTKYPAIPLGEACSVIRDGTHKTPTYVEGGVPFATVRNIVSGSLDLSTAKFISEIEHQELTRRVKPRRGDVLVSKDGTIGVPCPVQTDIEFSIFVSVALIRPDPSKLDQIFLSSQFKTEWIQRQIRDNSKGIAIRHLHLEDFRRLQFICPPLSSQREFSHKVSVVEAARASYLEHLAKLDALFASLQHRAFNGELTAKAAERELAEAV